MDLVETLERAPYAIDDVVSLEEYVRAAIDLNDATADANRAFAGYVDDGSFGSISRFAGFVLTGSGLVTAISSGPGFPVDLASAIYPAALIAAGVAAYSYGASRLRSRKAHREALAENLPVLLDAVERADELRLPVRRSARLLLEPDTVLSWWHD